jgi:hypothetical protein
MPIKAYLSNHRSEIRLAPNDGFDPQTGATYQGDVLTGNFTATDAFQREADRARPWNNMRTPCSPDDYDPVLKHHLRQK